MTLSPDVIDGLPYVEGVLNYLTPMAERPINLAYDPPLGVPRSTGVPEAHRMTIYDVRPVAARLSLDSEGLALVTHNSAVRDFYDEDELQRVYYPEAERLVAEVTGATRVLVFDHTVRRRVWGGVDRSAGTPRQPVTVVHNDYTIDSGPQRVRDLVGDDAGELLNHRFEIVNVWRRPCLGAQELRFEELMRNVNAAASAELEKLVAAAALGNDVVRAGEVALRQARTAQISLQVEKENLTAMMVKETLPLFVERLKEALIIRERRWNDDVKRRRLATAGLMTLGLVFGGYAAHVWQAWTATGAYDWCWAHPLPASGRVYCDMTGFGIAAQ